MEVITVAVGQAIFSRFSVPPDGQRLVRSSRGDRKIEGLLVVWRALWYGFCIKHIVRILCETEYGATCAAICACLSVSYDSFLASQGLKALADEYTPPGRLTPALSQWCAFIDVCSGALKIPNFQCLWKDSLALQVTGTRGIRRPLHTLTTGKALAGVLKELPRASNGSLRIVTFECGIGCGWIAAVAQWYYRIVELLNPWRESYVMVTKNDEGNFCYSQHADCQSLLLFYRQQKAVH